MKPTEELQQIQKRLDFYYERLCEYDEDDREDYQTIDYIKERISFWKKELLKAEEHQFFKDMDALFGIENE